jgi:hypothetical protein
MDWGGVTTANVYGGWISQDYYNFADPINQTIDFGADILWNVTPLTSIEGKAGRSIQETSTTVSPSALATGGSIQVSHELQRNIVLQSTINYTGFAFQDSTRYDDVYDAGVGGRYYVNRHIFTDLTYDFQRRGSNAPGNDYDAHVAFLRLGLQY